MFSGKVKRAVSSVLAAVLLTATAILPPSAFAQTANTGAITGVVQNQKGEVVSDATVRAVNVGTNATRETKTSSEGSYEISSLVPGTYRVEIEAPGFAKHVQSDVVVNTLQRTTVNPEMKVGAVTEVVNVTAENAALVETTKTDVGGVIDQRRLENLPVNGRSFASLAILIPGATLQPSFDPTKARVGTFSVGGSTGRNLNITVDGGDNKDNAVGGILQNFSMEGIQEFALSTQRFSAANGRSG
ncbi:MAG: carboxypeptidase regulatory-like domain-containing protein, partial [Rubrivivax sp.]|nr:carboxypeptidase regulatory-like domain-containing protein [Pyrinomonadaceae bacterium]